VAAQDPANRSDGSDTGVTFLHRARPSQLGERLPRGQHELSRDYVADHQRLRILEATTFVVAEDGYEAMTVGAVVKYARVSRRTFYEHFETREHCFLAAFGAGTQCMGDAVRTAYQDDGGWADRTGAALIELMRLMIEYPATGITCFVSVGSAGYDAERQRAAAVAMCRGALGQVIADAGADRPAPATLELAVGGLCEVIRQRLVDGRPENLMEELPEIATALLEPLTGADRARAVASGIRARVPEQTSSRERAQQP
jgi:AcrR family transcriptional regulator